MIVFTVAVTVSSFSPYLRVRTGPAVIDAFIMYVKLMVAPLASVLVL